MGTFHSIFIRFLREFADSLKYPSSFTIYDTSDSTSAIKACIKALGLDDKVYKPKDVLSRISLAKNNLITASAYRNNQKALIDDSHSRKPRICDIYTMYDARCRQAGVMDFDDILLNMNILLRDNPVAKASIQDRFDYIMVDEYQDTNFAQYLILKKLSEKHRNICVVGDDSQSIYAFRGAKIENILNFRKDYPECKVVRLEKNYRSTSNIVNAANSVIRMNSNRIPKNCIAVGSEGDKLRLLDNYTEMEEGLRIASEIISKMQDEHAEYQDFAILYRTNSQSRALEETLRKRNLPYVIYSGNSFFERAEVKDMMAYLKLAVNVNDDESFKRVVNTPARGIGETSLKALDALAKELKVSLFKAAYSDRFAEFGLKPAAAVRIRAFCDMIDRFASQAQTEQADKLALSLSDACGLYAFFKADQSIESQSRAENVQELLNSVAQFVEDIHQDFYNEYIEDMGPGAEDIEPGSIDYPVVTLSDFLENISLLSAVDMEDEEDTRNRIALMTVHSAKGLEFKYVFIAGLEENLFPSGGMLASPSDIEEERRLFYVALTRAKKALYLSFARTRMRNGKHESNSPSRFVREIDPQYIANPLGKDQYDAVEIDDEFRFNHAFRGFGSRGGSYGGSKYGMSGKVTYIPKGQPQRPSSPSPSPSRQSVEAQKEALRNRPLPPKIPDSEFIPVDSSKLKVGDRIEHNRFGAGKILEITGKVPDLKARISFDKYGEKLLLLKYAKIRYE